jgi:hypothetical protein
MIGGFTLGRSAPTASAEIVDVDDLSPHNDDGNIFSSSGTMPIARAYHTATAYRPGAGLILVAGGGGGSDGTTELADCRIWVISVNGFRDTGHLNIARRLHTATLIEGSGTSLDGSVLVTGGLPIDTAGDTAEIFNPDTEEWTLLSAHLHSPRQGHQATLLTQGALKGKVLITGGGTDIAEVFDPKTESFVELSDLTESFRWMFGAVELNTGQVLLTDGGDQHGELWDPGTLRFTTVSSANRLERYAPSVFRFQFPAGRGPVTGGPVDNVMIVGGATYMGGTSPWLAHADVEQFVLGTAGSGQYYSSDPAEGGINLGDPRAFSAGCDLGDNRYLITGGIPSTAIGAPPSNRDLDSVLLFDPQP